MDILYKKYFGKVNIFCTFLNSVMKVNTYYIVYTHGWFYEWHLNFIFGGAYNIKVCSNCCLLAVDLGKELLNIADKQ